jgi:ubiquinone/menaquinone biosynthesis C-methylase UbiE
MIMSHEPATANAWYLDAFRAEYLEVYPWRDQASAEQEVDRALEWLSVSPQDRVLDLCCGAGRHSHWIRNNCSLLYSLDLSESLLKRARSQLGRDAALVRADVRTLPFADASFDQVLMFFTSFGYFATDEENGSVLKEVARVVRVDGGLLLDLPDRDSTIEGLVASSHRSEGDLSIEEHRSLSVDGKRVEKSVVLERGGNERRYTESVRLYHFDEMETLLIQAGWKISDCHGDWQGGRYICGESPRMIMVARRQDEER